MCGITGVLHLSGEPVSYVVIKRMSEVIRHRGPDGDGVYANGPVGFGHRRLAILDVSPAGQQPMGTPDGRFVLVFNGEIYNFQQLRIELSARGHQFHSKSDTEVLLHAFVEWGEECIPKLNGMFAFAIWDNQEQRLVVARDRFGVKPLYWTMQNNRFIFSSEIKSILAHPGISPKVSVTALNEYFSFQNILSDKTLFENIFLLPPGNIIKIDLKSGKTTQSCFWDYSQVSSDQTLDEATCVEQLRELMAQAVVRQLQSDVPVGSYLSGGLDSGAITAIAAKQLPRLLTFTGGFDLTSASGLELNFDERHKAEVLSNLYKTEHYEVVMHAGDMEWVMSHLIWHLEDLRVGQCYPNYYVARLASKFVKVVLSGAGGDELFAGYPWRYFRGLGSGSSEDYFRRYFDFWQRVVSEQEKSSLFNKRVQSELGDHSAFDVFKGVFSGWKRPLETSEQLVEASLYFELKTFMHGLLVVEDKLSMAHSLESRVPFLDNDLVDFALKVPVKYKLRNLGEIDRVDENTMGKRHLFEQSSSDGKQVLRKALAAFIPPEVNDRVKQGFAAPDASWFRGESINYINDLLRRPSARIYEFLEPNFVGSVLDQHCSGAVNKRLLIWSLLSFEHLLQRYF